MLATSNGFMIDIFSTFLSPLEQELTAHSSYSVGKSHSIGGNSNYMERIEAVNFALDNDDGARTHYYDKADLILVGVSRCGKTPTCLYMAMHWHPRSQLPADRRRHGTPALPTALKKHQHKLFGLTIDLTASPRSATSASPTVAMPALPSANSKCAKWRTCSAARTFRTSTPPTSRWKRSPRRSWWKKA